MAFGSAEVIRADVEFRANTAGFTGDMSKIRSEAERTFGALDSTTLKAALASEKYDRALARSKGSTFAVAKATATYKSELSAIESAESRATGATHRHSNALRDEERGFGKVARGALVGSGALGRFGRAAIFASSSLLGGYGLAYAIRSTIQAASEQQVALGHAQVALENSGLSWQRYGRQIQEALDLQIKATGFTDNELTDSFAAFVRRFGDINQALHANALAADVARAKNISLADAQTLVMRASFGNPRSLRILGIELAKNTANMDALKASTKHATAEQIANAKAADLQANELNALDQVRAKYHGEAARFLQTDAGKLALFNAELDKSKEIIGGQLLPVFNVYLVRLTNWLEKMNRSGKLQHDVNQVVKVGGQIAHDFGATAKFVSDNLGGWKHALEILLALKVASTFAGWTGGAVKLARSLRGIGTAATVAEGEAVALKGGLGGLAALGPISIPILLDVAIVGGGAAALIKLMGWGGKGISQSFGGSPSGKPTGEDPNDPRTWSPWALAAEAAKHGPEPASWYLQHPARAMQIVRKYLNPNTSGMSNDPMHDATDRRHKNAGRGGAGNQSIVVGLTNAQQTPLLKAEGTTSTADDVAALQAELAILDKQLQQQGLTPAQENEILSERNQALSTLQSINSAAASKAAEAERKRREAAKRAREEILRQRKKRLQSLTEAPVDLRIQEATARAHHASEETLVKILEQEKQAIERQVATLKKIGAGKEYILKARQHEAAIQSKINTLLKKKPAGTSEQQGFIDSLSGILGQFASDVGIGSKSGAGPAKVIHVNVDQRGQEVSAWAAARAAREAAMHLL